MNSNDIIRRELHANNNNVNISMHEIHWGVLWCMEGYCVWFVVWFFLRWCPVCRLTHKENAHGTVDICKRILSIFISFTMRSSSGSGSCDALSQPFVRFRSSSSSLAGAGASSPLTICCTSAAASLMLRFHAQSSSSECITASSMASRSERDMPAGNQTVTTKLVSCCDRQW